MLAIKAGMKRPGRPLVRETVHDIRRGTRHCFAAEEKTHIDLGDVTLSAIYAVCLRGGLASSVKVPLATAVVLPVSLFIFR